jgi:DNA topoisomerase I
MPRLRRVACSAPGLTRRRCGRGFAYADARGRPLRDPEELARIDALAIPPAWQDVWICADPLGHLQAVGTDSRGRRQYLYHQLWRVRRDRRKFDRMLDFADRLPVLRERCAKELAAGGLEPDRVLACAVSLIDLGLFRVGSPEYTRDNGTFGLCTIEKRHVRIEDGGARFTFVAKGGRDRAVRVSDPDVVATLVDLKARRRGGPRLLVARGPAGWRPQQPADVNRWIKQVVGPEFSAKDFRTWNATVLAAVTLAGEDPERPRAAVRRAVEIVAESLGNTPAVARRSYIDPRVVDRFLEGRTVAAAGGDRAAVEAEVADLIADT